MNKSPQSVSSRIKATFFSNDHLSQFVWCFLLFISFFIIYQVSLAVNPQNFSIYWFFGADSMEGVFTGSSEPLVVPKHPLFAIVSRPLYWLSTNIYQSIPGVLGQNLALVFPVAIFGALSVSLGYLIFHINSQNRLSALLFALMYGISASPWIFFSFPDTYALTALCTILFFIVFIRYKDQLNKMPLVAAFNALVCYASPQQIFLAIIPVYYYLRGGNFSKRSIITGVKYGILLGVFFVVPYEIYIISIGLNWKLPPGYVFAYADFNNFFQLGWYAVIFLNFFVYSIIGPVVHPRFYVEPSLNIINQLSISWLLIVFIYLTFSAFSLTGLRTSKTKLIKIIPGVLIYLLSSALFFLFFNPKEAFIYSLPNLFLWYLFLHSGYDKVTTYLGRVVLLIMLSSIAINNFNLISFINNLTH